VSELSAFFVRNWQFTLILFAGLAVATKLILGFFLVIMISLLLFWSYAPAAIRTRLLPERLPLRIKP
jgi:hypothetical protein